MDEVCAMYILILFLGFTQDLNSQQERSIVFESKRDGGCWAHTLLNLDKQQIKNK